MILKKLFGKKSEDYFLEVDADTLATATTSTTSDTEGEDAPTAEATPETATSDSATGATTPSKPAKPVVNFDPPEWVSAIKDYSNSNVAETIAEPSGDNNYAGKYVSNNVNISPRRPGPSIDKFRELASKLKR